MAQVSADKAYLSSDNLQVVADHDAQPFIAFKSEQHDQQEPLCDLEANVSLLLLQSSTVNAVLSQTIQR